MRGLQNQSSVQFKWREPWLTRLRLHGDVGPRFVLSLAVVAAAGSIFFLIGLAEKGWHAAPVAGLFGAVFFGGLLSLGVFFSPEGIGGRVSISDQAIRRHRDTLGFLQGEHIREKWSCIGLACVIVPAELIQQSFSLLVLPSPSGRRTVYVGVPSRIDLSELARFLTGAGVHVDSATVELAASVKADHPYRSRLAKGVFALCVAITIGIVVTVAIAGNRIAGN